LGIDVQIDGVEPFEPVLKFLIAPNRDARSMVTLWITVMEAPSTRIEGATVEILDGYPAGTVCTTLAGLCLVPYVPAGEAYTLRVAKSGYQPATVRHEVVEGVVTSSLVTVTLARE
jgi:hypothetical protein